MSDITGLELLGSSMNRANETTYILGIEIEPGKVVLGPISSSSSTDSGEEGEGGGVVQS